MLTTLSFITVKKKTLLLVEILMTYTKFMSILWDLVESIWITTNERMCVEKCVFLSVSPALLKK